MWPIVYARGLLNCDELRYSNYTLSDTKIRTKLYLSERRFTLFFFFFFMGTKGITITVFARAVATFCYQLDVSAESQLYPFLTHIPPTWLYFTSIMFCPKFDTIMIIYLTVDL